jgi:hypothetical protein
MAESTSSHATREEYKKSKEGSDQGKTETQQGKYYIG